MLLKMGATVAEETFEEVKKRNIDKMGEKLGTQFSALWNELSILYFYWEEYNELFGTKPSRIELMNQAAPAFFHPGRALGKQAASSCADHRCLGDWRQGKFIYSQLTRSDL
jgi:hypothetical protein